MNLLRVVRVVAMLIASAAVAALLVGIITAYLVGIATAYGDTGPLNGEAIERGIYHSALTAYKLAHPGFTKNPPQPPVVGLPHDALNDIMCEGSTDRPKCETINWLGSMVRGTLYYTEDLETRTPGASNVLFFHETIHYLQSVDQGLDPDQLTDWKAACENLKAREIEAYGLGLEYSMQHGAPYWMIMGQRTQIQRYTMATCALGKGLMGDAAPLDLEKNRKLINGCVVVAQDAVWLFDFLHHKGNPKDVTSNLKAALTAEDRVQVDALIADAQAADDIANFGTTVYGACISGTLHPWQGI